MKPIVELAAAAAIYGAARWWYPRAAERASAARLPVGPDGIIAGAGAMSMRPAGATRGVLVLHGFGDTPESVSTVVRALAARGYAVEAPLLAGHGRTLPGFAASDGAAWLESARAGLGSLAARTPVVAIVGQSLGGALAVLLAAEHPEVRTLVLLAPYLDAAPRAPRSRRSRSACSIYSHPRTIACRRAWPSGRTRRARRRRWNGCPAADTCSRRTTSATPWRRSSLTGSRKARERA